MRTGAIKVAILANCQARPLARILPLLNPAIEVSGITVTHLAQDSQRDEEMAKWHAADVIFAQAVAPNYPVKFVTTAALQQEFGGKLLTWPNIFFRGQCPDLHYLTGEKRRRILSPLAEYHSRHVYQSWREGRPVAETIRLMDQGGDWIDTFRNVPAESLAQLKARETGLSVRISDEIEARWQSEQLFFTFNHPAMKLLGIVGERLLGAFGLAAANRLPALPEALGRLVPMVVPVLARAIGLSYAASSVAVGQDLDMSGPVKMLGTVRTYALPEFVELSYRCYDQQLTRDGAVTIT